MSKMQMLMFAVGISIVALLLLNFVGSIGLKQEADSVLFQTKKIIEEQLSTDAPCTDKFINIPDSFVNGFNRRPYFYDLGFFVETLGSGEQQASSLSMTVSEHRPSSSERRYVSGQLITSEASFVLVDSAFLLEGSGLLNSFGKNPVFFNPRAASSSPILGESSPNNIAIVKDTTEGKVTIYIIPCTSLNNSYTCTRNILRVGCYLLKQKNPVNATKVQSCFNIETEVAPDKSKNFTWEDCQSYFSDALK
jgi:hypothetical protein